MQLGLHLTNILQTPNKVVWFEADIPKLCNAIKDIIIKSDNIVDHKVISITLAYYYISCLACNELTSHSNHAIIIIIDILHVLTL